MFTTRELDNFNTYPYAPLHLHASEPEHLSAYERLTHSERQRKLDYLESISPAFKEATPAH